MEELKPCPFCGGEAILLEDWKDGNFIVGCANNDCIARLSGIPSFDNAEQAVKAWNTRAERTCKKRNHDTDNYYMRCCSCSLCNSGWFEDIYDKPFSYCPHCGAKVVG